MRIPVTWAVLGVTQYTNLKFEAKSTSHVVEAKSARALYTNFPLLFCIVTANSRNERLPDSMTRGAHYASMEGTFSHGVDLKC